MKKFMQGYGEAYADLLKPRYSIQIVFYSLIIGIIIGVLIGVNI